MANDVDKDGEFSLPRPDKARFRETTSRLRRGKEAHLSHRASLDWRLDQHTVCVAGAGASAETVPVEELRAMLMQSRTAETLLAGAQAETLHIVYDAQVPTSQFYPPSAHRPATITLNPYRPKGDLLNLLARELRRNWHYFHGALLNPMDFEPDEAILVNRAQLADALMISIKIAWELRLGGNSEAWDYLVGSPMSDVSRTFEIKAQTDFRSLNNGTAARAAYDKFFEESRTKIHDKRIIHQMLLDETGYMKSQKQRSRVSMDLFKRLGELPQGRNYLAMKAERTPMDSGYASVEDRSNANFLWFIKFERSFQEKEQQMVRESVKMSAEVVDFCRFAQAARQGHGTAGQV
jgi:hypothetical protein